MSNGSRCANISRIIKHIPTRCGQDANLQARLNGLHAMADICLVIHGPPNDIMGRDVQEPYRQYDSSPEKALLKIFSSVSAGERQAVKNTSGLGPNLMKLNKEQGHG